LFQGVQWFVLKMSFGLPSAGHQLTMPGGDTMQPGALESWESTESEPVPLKRRIPLTRFLETLPHPPDFPDRRHCINWDETGGCAVKNGKLYAQQQS
jgi:hypothetical protein